MSAERGQTYPVPPLDCLWLCLFGRLMQRLGSASSRSTAMRIHGRGLQSGKPRSGQASLQCLLPDSLLVWSGRKALGIAPGLPFQCRHFSVLILSQPERHLALSLPLCRCHCLRGILVQAALLPLCSFSDSAAATWDTSSAPVYSTPIPPKRSALAMALVSANSTKRVCQFCISLT